MKKKFCFLLLLLSLSNLSCENRMKSCINSMMEDGYSYEDAEEICEDARLESLIRR